MDRKRVRCFVNIFLVLTTIGAWLVMCFSAPGTLALNGFGSLKYFTVQSNLLVGFVAIAWLICTGKGAKAGAGSAKGSDSVIARIELLKYISAAAVGLTFTTVIGFLGPIYGYPAMFEGANLFLHLIGPIGAMLEIIFLSEASFTRKENRLVMIPSLLYGLGYLANNLVNGFGEWPDTNDWYFFFHWGYPVGMLIYAILVTVTWLLGFMMRNLQRKRAS
ncbi:MAG: hypothetical protein IJG48_01750 [Mogibacterium sp.]|nr:hypothetical protein [Mogibacterium sp.]